MRPQPREWFHAPSDYELKIPKSAPLTYTQLPFYLHGLSDTVDIKQLIGHVRDISEKFEARGLPNYPSGKNFFYFCFKIFINNFFFAFKVFHLYSGNNI